ncbi:MAG TPA: alpha-1,4-glucan--maltose-1-phosphate maltosyltransferase [Chthoniobacteraceae bacterium]|jgi:starch synthase (maltosyl-transferring)|nr:alpha-1,4-glucan--maltose-1-phosphate maltosyltransferase [Chthoniobacteraceae bacterium]
MKKSTSARQLKRALKTPAATLSAEPVPAPVPAPAAIASPEPALPESPGVVPQFITVTIENVSPLIDGGRYAIKRASGEDLTVEADIFMAGHDVVSAVLKWRVRGAGRWSETAMKPIPNGQDRWRGTLSVFDNAEYEYTIEAWVDAFRSWQHEFRKKFEGGVTDLSSETIEGAHIVQAAAARAGAAAAWDAARLREIAAKIERAEPREANEIARWGELEGLMAAWPDRSLTTEFQLSAAGVAAGYPRVMVDRERALYAAWYEFFPRSAEGHGDRGSTFRDCLNRIDDAKAMGFDVIYFPPIHPVGTTKRKGRNNSVTSEPGDPGVPYAIGNRNAGCPNGGGHKDIEPALGTFEDFAWLIGQLEKRGMELALDFAINCSPDHPYVHDKPEWFFKRPDGTIKYAENPPKKYEDVYPLNFFCDDWRALWEEMASIILFWAEKKVRIFRVDNPHTKPVAFWEYLIAKVRAKFPDTIFLSEAFTRPKMMKILAKAGFQQSYTYFTWRNFKHELTEYFTELTQTEMKEYFRGNLFPNTPDILPYLLQQGGRPAFMIRAVLAATLSSVYGIYSGFELCENAALPNKEEYLDSEKYQYKQRDWSAPGNIKDLVTRLNRVRRENRALQQYDNLRFYTSENDNILFYGKATESRDNIVLIAVNLDPYQSHDAYIYVPVEEFGWMDSDTYQVHDLLTNERYLWRGSRNYVLLDPHTRPAHVFRVRRWLSREQDFDYYL